MKFDIGYILYIYVSSNEVREMTIADPSKIDNKLAQIYANQVTTVVSSNYEDRSDMLLAQMNFIAINNKSFITYRKQVA